MPRLSIWIIRTALMHLGAGSLIGALMLFNKGVPIMPAAWSLLPLHIEVLLVGWVVQLAMGVAYWVLPRWHTERGRIGLVVAAYILVNSGVFAAGFSGWLPFGQIALIVGRSLETIAVLLFAIHAWPRIKPLGI